MGLNSRMGKGEGSGEGWGEGQGKGGEWKGSLCGSCDCGSKCFIGCCCPPCGNYFVAQKMNEEGWPAWIGFLDFVEVVDYVLSSEQWCCVEKSVKGMESRGELAEIAVLQCAAFPVLNANMQITLELTNKYKKFSNLPHNYRKSAYRHFYITDNYRFVMNAKNHSLISCIIKVILIFSYSYYKYLNIFLFHLFLLTDMTGCKNIINNKLLP